MGCELVTKAEEAECSGHGVPLVKKGMGALGGVMTGHD
jgi:hypothetical protein